uniref:Uncharacterized protein n=1 Tax=Cannabis sativa TaxID=3483 RepID=A0A803QHT2_CANSA
MSGWPRGIHRPARGSLYGQPGFEYKLAGQKGCPARTKAGQQVPKFAGTWESLQTHGKTYMHMENLAGTWESWQAHGKTGRHIPELQEQYLAG